MTPGAESEPITEPVPVVSTGTAADETPAPPERGWWSSRAAAFSILGVGRAHRPRHLHRGGGGRERQRLQRSGRLQSERARGHLGQLGHDREHGRGELGRGQHGRRDVGHDREHGRREPGRVGRAGAGGGAGAAGTPAARATPAAPAVWAAASDGGRCGRRRGLRCRRRVELRPGREPDRGRRDGWRDAGAGAAGAGAARRRARSRAGPSRPEAARARPRALAGGETGSIPERGRRAPAAEAARSRPAARRGPGAVSPGATSRAAPGGPP